MGYSEICFRMARGQKDSGGRGGGGARQGEHTRNPILG